MTEWYKVKGNANLIQHETDKAVLIKIPKSELMFWHPQKLIKTAGKNNYLLLLSFTKDWKFKAFRNGRGKANFNKKIEERDISAQEMVDFWGGEYQADNKN